MIQVLGASDFTPLSHDILRRGASGRHSTQADDRSSDLHLLRSRGYQKIPTTFQFHENRYTSDLHEDATGKQ